ncbi:MAG: sodium-dependent bicarbonate transport family permease [bacterium]|nr:sodium-dependent bicarbonate transport family permease [bacterium]
MEFIVEFLLKLLSQLQTPTLAFLIGGMVIAAFKSKLQIPQPIYQFIVFMLLMRIGLNGGMKIRDANFIEMIPLILATMALGVAMVFLGRFTLSFLPGVKTADGIATAGLFGAVSASTLAAATVSLEESGVAYEAWVPALYPFMDIPALVTAIVMANIAQAKAGGGDAPEKIQVWSIIKQSLRGSALSALLLGMLLGLASEPKSVFDGFYDPLFRGMLSILMLVMGIEAYERLNELRKVAHWFAFYAAVAPIVHGLMAFGVGYLAHLAFGFSAGGTVVLALLAASNSDVSGPPTLRAGIPAANPSSYIGASTSVGTPVAIAFCIPFFIGLAEVVFE